MPPEASVGRAELEQWLARELQVTRVRDYCPNGLQVAGAERITQLVTGVTASLEFLEAAVARGADAVLVHHGWFWKNDDPRVVGMLRRRLAYVLQHDLNLFAYHLPLDVHPAWGNNAQLARVLGLVPHTQGSEDGDRRPCTLDDAGLLWQGVPDQPMNVGEFVARVQARLGRAPLWVGDASAPLHQVVWCTGGAQGYMQQAIDAGASLYLTGEASEYNTHLARESGCAFVAAGHHATERYGAPALGNAVARQFGIATHFIDIPNPV